MDKSRLPKKVKKVFPFPNLYSSGKSVDTISHYFARHSGLTQMVGHAAVSNSEFQITRLTPGTQYWAHVRAIRGSDFGPWSDPATRVANV